MQIASNDSLEVTQSYARDHPYRLARCYSWSSRAKCSSYSIDNVCVGGGGGVHITLPLLVHGRHFTYHKTRDLFWIKK